MMAGNIKMEGIRWTITRQLTLTLTLTLTLKRYEDIRLRSLYIFVYVL
jgi:hypothetical protein